MNATTGCSPTARKKESGEERAYFITRAWGYTATPRSTGTPSAPPSNPRILGTRPPTSRHPAVARGVGILGIDANETFTGGGAAGQQAHCQRRGSAAPRHGLGGAPAGPGPAHPDLPPLQHSHAAWKAGLPQGQGGQARHRGESTSAATRQRLTMGPPHHAVPQPRVHANMEMLFSCPRCTGGAHLASQNRNLGALPKMVDFLISR